VRVPLQILADVWRMAGAQFLATLAIGLLVGVAYLTGCVVTAARHRHELRHHLPELARRKVDELAAEAERLRADCARLGELAEERGVALRIVEAGLARARLYAEREPGPRLRVAQGGRR
jgi:outer membrane murein-binding lipoprotein Lpp